MRQQNENRYFNLDLNLEPFILTEKKVMHYIYFFNMGTIEI
jgi:hypothetical protein